MKDNFEGNAYVNTNDCWFRGCNYRIGALTEYFFIKQCISCGKEIKIPRTSKSRAGAGQSGQGDSPSPFAKATEDKSDKPSGTSDDPKFESEKYRLFDKDSGIVREYTLGQLINTSFRRGKFEYRGKSTGLRDSEGTLIWEGDVVSYITAHEDHRRNNGLVVWNTKEGGWYISLNNEPAFELSCTLEGEDDCKVLSNIYEHSELLVNPRTTDTGDSPSPFAKATEDKSDKPSGNRREG